jgi:hypothetical protein
MASHRIASTADVPPGVFIRVELNGDAARLRRPLPAPRRAAFGRQFRRRAADLPLAWLGIRLRNRLLRL